MRKLLFFTLLLLCLPLCSYGAHVADSFGFCNGVAFAGNIASVCDLSVLTKTFTYTPTGTNDAVAFSVTCAGATETTVTLTASGWTITALSPITGSSTAGWVASFGAIAPNTSLTTFTVTWSNTCGAFLNDFIGEFSGNDTTGGTTTFDAHNQGTNTTGNCSITVTPANNNDDLWGACNDSVTAVGSGFTKGGDDTVGDWSEWKTLSGGGGAAQTVDFAGTSGAWTEVAVSIKPAPAGPTATIGGNAVVGGKAVIQQ